MLRRSLRWFQMQRQYYADSIGYSAAFAPPNEHDVSTYQRATALYSPATASVHRRKWHGERQKKYTEKRKLMCYAARNDLAMMK